MLLGCVAATGCSKDPAADKRRHLEAGDAFFAKQQHSEAIVEYRNALGLDNRSAEIHYKLAEAYAALSDVRNALPGYVRAADLDPDNVDAHLKAVNLLLLARQYEDAKTRSRAFLAKHPKNATAFLQLGNAHAGLRSFDEAVAANERAVALDPKRVGMYVNLGMLQFISGNAGEAEAAYRKAVDVDSESVEARVALANFYWVAGRTAEAEREFARALELDPKDVRAHRTLAAFYLFSGRGTEAEAHLKTVIAIADDLSSKLALSDYYVSLQRLAEARAILNGIAADKRNFAAAKTRLALIEYVHNRREEAIRTLDEVLAREPQNAMALAIKAHALLGDNRIQEAEMLANAAIAADPESPRSHFARGKVMVAKWQLEEARKSFREVLKIQPRATEAHIELAQLHLARREVDSAIQLAEQGVRTDPRNLEARLTYARALMVRREDLPRAQEQIRLLQAQYPASADVYQASGELALAGSDPAAARRAFERALQLDPSSLQALNQLVTVDVQTKRFGDARKRMDLAVAKNPESGGVLLLSARTHAAEGNLGRAEEQLKRLLQLDASNLEGYRTLAGLYLVQGKLGEARREFIELTKRQPASAAPPTMLGIIADALRDNKEAESWYEKALQINPRAAAAANNLAWLYAERGVKLDAALEMAQTAYTKLPDQLEVADTLGWVYYKKDLLGMAIPLLERCVERDPRNPIYQYHLGMAFAKRGEDSRARTHLEKALKLRPDFNGADDARRALASLV